jgi:subtilase family serine protease
LQPQPPADIFFASTSNPGESMKALQLCLLSVLLLPFVPAQQAAAQSIVSDTRPVDTTTLAAEASNPSESMTVTVWLKMHDRDALEAAINQLYDPSSAQYHQWMSDEALTAYAPSGAEVAIVKEELQSHGLTLLADDPQRLYVRARGTLASMESTFHTRIGTFRNGARTFHTNVTPATLNGLAGELTAAVSGLDDSPFAPKPIQPLLSVRAGTVLFPQALAAGLGEVSTDRCFDDQPKTMSFGSPTADHATYTGNSYDPGTKLCTHTVAQIRAAYAMDEAYARGLEGDGQTIVLIELLDSPTLVADVNAFSQLNGLPRLRESQLEVVYPDGKPSALLTASLEQTRQTPADVEWAHAMAPKAHIVVVVPASPSDAEIQLALYYAIRHHLGNTINFSYNNNEADYGPVSIQPWDQVLSLAAARGIAVNVAAGDLRDAVTGSTLGGVGFPADSPHVTAVGGTVLGIPDGRGGLTETGFGGQFTAIGLPEGNGEIGAQLPGSIEFFQGTQGGASLVFAKPAYQRSLPGSGRLTPDVSLSANQLFLNEVIVYTDPTLGQLVASWGDTGVACSIFSGIWALANQHAHHALGQAAPAIARMAKRGKGIRDIVPVGSATNPSGVFVGLIQGQIPFAPPDLFAPFPVPAQFYSALFHDQVDQIFLPDEWMVYGFGLGGALTTTPGWDNMTGYGAPDGMAFLDAAAGEDDR